MHIGTNTWPNKGQTLPGIKRMSHDTALKKQQKDNLQTSSRNGHNDPGYFETKFILKISHERCESETLVKNLKQV